MATMAAPIDGPFQLPGETPVIALSINIIGRKSTTYRAVSHWFVCSVRIFRSETKRTIREAWHSHPVGRQGKQQHQPKCNYNYDNNKEDTNTHAHTHTHTHRHTYPATHTHTQTRSNKKNEFFLVSGGGDREITTRMAIDAGFPFGRFVSDYFVTLCLSLVTLLLSSDVPSLNDFPPSPPVFQ